MLWFKNYLLNRKQIVELNGHRSSQENIDISIIQGSILGPILFNVFINDLPNSTTMHLSLFADDGQGLSVGKNLPALVDVVNDELCKIATWFRANKMAVNTNKTKYMLFHTKGKKIDFAVVIPEESNRNPLHVARGVTDGYAMRRTAVDFGIPIFTNTETAGLYVRAITAYSPETVSILPSAGYRSIEFKATL